MPSNSMADEYGDDADYAAAFNAISAPTTTAPHSAGASASATTPGKIQQPTPQALPNRAAPSSILVSVRQKGNPILNNIRSLPWEYGDIPSDYVLGATTCALFLSLKYHRLHPEYIYSRIRALGGKYNLRVLLTMVDIQNHEESLRELSKTSLINNLTLILCWSSAEAGRYLELFKSYEHASANSIKAHQATSYADKLVEFITVPRSINKTDAVALVSAFGSIRAAANARPEEIAGVSGWGEKKVMRWYGTVREPFRMRKAAKRGVGLQRGESSVGSLRASLGDVGREDSLFEDGEADALRPASSEGPTAMQGVKSAPDKVVGAVQPPKPGSGLESERPPKRSADEVPLWEPGEDEEEALLLATAEEDALPLRSNSDSNIITRNATTRKNDMNEGMMAALAKLRQQ